MPDQTLPAPPNRADLFGLDPDIVYLNHGSFGACPKQVSDAQQKHRDRIEADAMRFYLHDLWGMIDRSRQALANLIGANPQDCVFVNNATTAVATVLSNIQLTPGDELIVTNFEYPACRNNFEFVANRCGAKVITADLPWDPICEDAVVDAIMTKVTSRTKLVLISLITSATALRLPVERIINELSARGIDTLLDAAHGPGCVPMDISSWGAAYTTGNGHKWLCSPKGVAFLHIREDLQDGFHPLVRSNDANDLTAACARTKRSPLNHEFDYMGTDDRTPVLSIADSIQFLDSVFPSGIDALMEHNRALCLESRDLLCRMLGSEPKVPDSMLGPLAVIDVPSRVDPKTMQHRLLENHRIETMLVASPTGGHPMVRVSPHIYNSIEQYQYLGEAILSECR